MGTLGCEAGNVRHGQRVRVADHAGILCGFDVEHRRQCYGAVSHVLVQQTGLSSRKTSKSSGAAGCATEMKASALSGSKVYLEFGCAPTKSMRQRVSLLMAQTQPNPVRPAALAVSASRVAYRRAATAHGS